MGLNRFDVIKQINVFSAENNQEGLIHLLCTILSDEKFKNENIDLIHVIISIGELYGYYSYIDYSMKNFDNSEELRCNMYRSHDKKIYYNSGQLSLLNEIKTNSKIFISAPTTFGKTRLVLEYLTMEYKKFSNILFIIPTNSLSEEIYIKILEFNHDLDLKYHVSTNPKLDGNRNILILTPEKYLLLLESKDPKFDLFVMDESYKIEEGNEKINYNDPLNSRSSKFRRVMEIIANKNEKSIFLSPYTYITDDSMDRFFSKYNIKKINRTENYVNKELIKVDDNDDFKNVFKSSKKGFLKSFSGVQKATYIVGELDKSTIVYIRYPKDALDFLKKVDGNIELGKISDRFKKFIRHIESNYEFDDSKWYILDGLKKGIGIYVSPTPRYIKREIVNLFNSGELKMLVVTSAFAEGVNSSAKNIIITNDVVGSNVKMTSLDLLNLSGRAGRFGVHSQGNIYSVKEDIHSRLSDCIDKGVKISNLNYENGDQNHIRCFYDIEVIDETYLNTQELSIKNQIENKQRELELTNEELNVALSISKYDKLKLYLYFKNSGEVTEERREIINNIVSKEKNEVVKSMGYIFNELRNAEIKIVYDDGDLPPYSKDNVFLWGKFYGIHSSGSIKEILKNRKKYIEREYNNYKKIDRIVEKHWIEEFITDGVVDNFKLYNQAFKFISNIIEYRIPFYIGFYVSIFNLYCKKNNVFEILDYDIVEISNSLENKVIEEKYNNLLEYGFSMEIIKKIQEGNDTPILLDEYENIMYDEYIKLMN